MAVWYKNPVYVAGLAVIAVAAYMLTSNDAPTKKGTAPRTLAKSSKNDTIYQPEDYTVQFTPVSDNPKDIFRPLVARKGAGVAGPNGPATIPTGLTGGEGNWVYSGMAVVDGTSTALVENQTTGESVFLHMGERWKAASVCEITPDQVGFIGPDGLTSTVHVKEDSATAVAKGNANAPVAVTPPLSGDIGAPVTVQPDTSGNAGGNSRRRRNRGNNGGGGNGNGAAPGNGIGFENSNEN